MTQDEIIYKLFGEEQDAKIDLYMPEIIDVLSKQKDKVTIKVKEVDDNKDIKPKIENPNYLTDELLKFTETGIYILHATKHLSEQLKPHLPKTVKELTIPSTFLNDLSYLQTFPNLETLHISDYSTFSKEEIEYIEKNTTIKNMILRSSGTFSSIKCKEGFNVIEAGNIIGQYKKLTLYNQGYSGKWEKYLKIYTSNYDDKNLKIIEAMYQNISNYLPETNAVSIFKKQSDIYNPEFKMYMTDGEIKKLTIEDVEPTEAARVYRQIIKGAKVKETKYRINNKTYEDIHQLKQMARTSDLKLNYNNSATTATYEEFIGMRETIDYYKELLETSNLSPIEQTTYVFDILKTMRYQENKKDKSHSRNIHTIVAEGNIVCAGYSEFAKQLLNEIGIKCVGVSVVCLDEDSNDAGHERNFVRIDDDKYNIHGLYALDITWDSDKDISVIEEDDGIKKVIARPSEDDKKKVIDEYDNLVLYRHFLIPMETYEQRFPDEINPGLYEIYKNGDAKTLVDEARKISSGEMTASEVENAYFLGQHIQLFDHIEDPLIVESYLSAKKPSLETFEEILTNVRKAQGYTQEEAMKDVDRVIELHQMLADQNPDLPNHFFKSSTK